MNYSDFSRSYSKTGKGGTNLYGKEPEFLLYQEDNYRTKKYQTKNEEGLMATKGIINGVVMCEDYLDPVTQLFFSKENIKRIQRQIRREVFKRTKGEYKLEVDQDESDLVVSMRAVLFDMYGARFLPFKITKQVKDLNKKVVNYVLPDMISEMKQEYAYIKEINQPLQVMMRPLNVNNAGRRTLPSITTVWGV